MKHKVVLTILCSCCFLSAASVSFGQTIISAEGGAPVGFSRDLIGTLAIHSATPGGCRTRVCTTNLVEEIHCTITNPHPVVVCRTNIVPHLECTTNIVTVIHCRTNDSHVVVCETNTAPRRVCVTNGFNTVVRCETNFVGTRVCVTNMVPRRTCTNVFTASGAVKLSQSLSGTFTPNSECDELGTMFPGEAMFQATWFSNVRTNDWRGLHNGIFKILVGTNVVAAGTLNGSNGVGSHGALEPCAQCSHFEGTLRGHVVQPGPLREAAIQATYAGDLTEADCGSTNIPQGAAHVTFDGVVVIPACRTVTPPH